VFHALIVKFVVGVGVALYSFYNACRRFAMIVKLVDGGQRDKVVSHDQAFVSGQHEHQTHVSQDFPAVSQEYFFDGLSPVAIDNGVNLFFAVLAVILEVVGHFDFFEVRHVG
jgi:hypothetical protein